MGSRDERDVGEDGVLQGCIMEQGNFIRQCCGQGGSHFIPTNDAAWPPGTGTGLNLKRPSKFASLAVLSLLAQAASGPHLCYKN